MEAFPRRSGDPLALPITLAEALHHLKEESDDGENDAYVLTLIDVARQACEDRTERTLISTPWLLTLDGFPEAIPLHQPPIIAVQSIQFTDADGLTQTLSPADYEVNAVSVPGYVVPAYGKGWPATRSQINAVRVNYSAGYGVTAASVPKPLIQWMKLAIGDMYTNRNASSDRPVVRHNFVDSLLEPYKVWG